MDELFRRRSALPNREFSPSATYKYWLSPHSPCGLENLATEAAPSRNPAVSVLPANVETEPLAIFTCRTAFPSLTNNEVPSLHTPLMAPKRALLTLGIALNKNQLKGEVCMNREILK